MPFVQVLCCTIWKCCRSTPISLMHQFAWIFFLFRPRTVHKSIILGCFMFLMVVLRRWFRCRIHIILGRFMFFSVMLGRRLRCWASCCIISLRLPSIQKCRWLESWFRRRRNYRWFSCRAESWIRRWVGFMFFVVMLCSRFESWIFRRFVCWKEMMVTLVGGVLSIGW